MEGNLGFNFIDRERSDVPNMDKLHFDTSNLRSGFNMLKLLAEQAKSGSQSLSWVFDKGWESSGLNPGAYGEQQINLIINKFQKALSDYTSSVLDSLNTLKDASEDFKDSYDKITGSMYYENKKLKDAYSDVNKLTKGGDFASYLKDQVTEIDDLSEFFSKKNISILMNEDPANLTKQLALVDELQAKTGLVFKNGASDALDYLDSIKLVSDAMEKSRNNIKSFTDSFKSKSELVDDMAKSISYLGVKMTDIGNGINVPMLAEVHPQVAKTQEELKQLFEKLKGGVGGLTDQELEFLNANKDLLDSEGKLTNTTKGLEDAFNSLEGGIRSQINSVQSLLASVNNSINSVTASRNKYLGTITSRSDVMNSLDYFGSLSGSKKYSQANKTMSVIDSFYNAQKKAIEDNTQTAINGLNNQEQLAEKNYQARYDSLKKEHDAIESINGEIKSLHDYAKSLVLNNTNLSPSQSLQMWKGVFDSSYNNLTGAIAANNVDNVQKFSGDTRTYSQSYIDSARANTSTAQQYEMIVGQIAGKLGATQLKDNTTLGDVNDGLKSIKASFDRRIASLQYSQKASIDRLNREAATWLDKMNVQLKDEKDKLVRINDVLEEKFADLQKPVSDIDLALQEMHDNQLTIDQVVANINNTEAHYRRLEALLAETNAKLDKVANNTNSTADNLFTRGAMLIAEGAIS